MFCSNCGKTIPQGEQSCPKCGMVIGGGEFTSGAYVASQPRVSQGAGDIETKPRYTPYTRTTYTTMDEAESGDVFRRTSYRPVLEEEPAVGQQPASEPLIEPEQEPEPKADPAEAKPAPAPETAIIGDPDALSKSVRARPFEPVRLPGISAGTQERMRRLQQEESGEAPKRPAKPVVASLFSMGGRGAGTKAPKREVFPREDEIEPESLLDSEGEDVFDTSDIEDDEETSRRPRLFERRADGARAGSRKPSVVATALIAVCVVALLVGGFIWLSYRTAARSPITGVTYTLFEQGVKRLEEHAGDEYRAEILKLFAEDPTGASAASKQTQDRANLTALLPGTPLANDQEFMNALLAIQANIENALTLDGLMANDTEGALAALGGDADKRWSAIHNAITRLKAATDPMQLSAIGESSAFSATPTPAPTPTVSPYSTLTKGMKDSEDVLKLQNRLYELGWFTDVRDGDFGALTQTAVKLFQQASGLNVTGIADPDTLAAIYDEGALRTGNRITSPPAATQAPDAVATQAPVATVAPANPN